MKRRDFVRWSVRAAGGLVSVPLLQACGGGSKGDTVVPPLAIRNAYRRVDLLASKASCGAPFTVPGFVDAWGIALRPAGAGGASYEFVGDVSASGADALSTSASIGKTTGVAFNGAPINSNQFLVTTQSAVVEGVSVTSNGSARFIFVTDSGSCRPVPTAPRAAPRCAAMARRNWCTTARRSACPCSVWRSTPPPGTRCGSPISAPPRRFGTVGGAGKIAAFNQSTGRFMDYLRDESGTAIGLFGSLRYAN